MKKIIFALLLLHTVSLFSQTESKPTFERKGFIFGLAAGFSQLNLTGTPSWNQNISTFTIPNIKIGRMISQRTALAMVLPGSVYNYTGPGRKRARGFEGIIPSVQFWPKDKWWIMGGLGITQDAPAFYDIKNEDEKKFYFGPSVLAGTGFELWRKSKFALDLQARTHFGYAKFPDAKEKGITFDVLVGFNWY